MDGTSSPYITEVLIFINYWNAVLVIELVEVNYMRVLVQIDFFVVMYVVQSV